MPSSILRTMRRLAAGVAVAVCVAPSLAAAGGRVDFETEVRPIFERNCYECHGPRERNAVIERLVREVLPMFDGKIVHVNYECDVRQPS